MLDEPALASVLASHFRKASREQIDEAVQDVLLLELLETGDAGVAWEDAMQDPDHAPICVFEARRRCRPPVCPRRSPRQLPTAQQRIERLMNAIVNHLE